MTDTPDTARAPRGWLRSLEGAVMTFAAVTVLGLTLGQPLGPDYYPMNSRTIKLPIEYKKDRKSIRNVLLYVARNGENTWYQEGVVTPDKDHFVYIAKDDGIYWFKMVIEDLKGNKDPADLTRDPPDLKMLIDTTAPQVRVTGAKRNGEEVVIEWAIDEKFPNDVETKVHFRPSDNPRAYWQEVTLPANSRTGVKFPCSTQDGVTVRITAVDVAGNKTEVVRDYPAAGASTSLKEPQPDAGLVAPGPPDGKGPVGINYPQPTKLDPIDLTPPVGPTGPGPLAPAGPGPVAPAPPPATTPAPPAVAPTVPHAPTQPPATGHVYASTQPPLATVDPKAPPSNALATHSGATPAAATSPTVEVSRAQVINYARFDLGFDVEQRGPSGIKRVDVWVTRDEGRTWRKWHERDGRGGAVRVELDLRENPQLEGSYGFRLVPVSGTGLSEGEPPAGAAPEMRVVLDVTAPQITLYPPEPDRTAPDTLVLKWSATDHNFGDDPIMLEWSEAAGGPWKPVAAAGNDPVVQAGAGNAPIARRLANTGQYAWHVPAGVPAHVYLKATARDAAGNVKEVVTVKPIPVDLTKPRAKINGIAPASSPRP